VRAEARRHLLGEAANHADGVLQRIPARDLDDGARVRRQRPVLDDLRAALDAPARPVRALERHRMVRRPARHELGGPQHPADGVGRQVDVLRGEGVDRRHDHGDALAVQALPGERLAREDEGLGVAEIR